jgi:hypothetical protein
MRQKLMIPLLVVSLSAGCSDSKSSMKTLTGFSIVDPAANGVLNLSPGGNSVSVSVPFGTDLTHLVASFLDTGATVKVGNVVQISGVTVNDFTNPVVYTIVAADGSTTNFTVTVVVAPNTAKAITSFSIGSSVGTINDNAHTITVAVPAGTNLTALVPTFTTTGASVSVGSTGQVSGVTSDDFTSPVTFTVTAADGSTQPYTITVSASLSSAKAITEFSVAAGGSAVAGTIDETGKTIAITVPFGTNVTTLVSTFTSTGASVKVGTTLEVSGTTMVDFSSPVMYVVTAADGTTATYTVTVTVASNSAKAITAFSIDSVSGTIDEVHHTITVTVPFGTGLTALVSTFTTTGASVKVGTTTQMSGITADDFTSPVMYVVTAADNSTVTYTVTVTAAVSPAKAITAFSLGGFTGVIDENNRKIAVNVPFGTDVTALVATFTDTGSSVDVGTTAQVSGTTANNFTNPVMYVVTATDQTMATYTVTVTVSSMTDKAIKTFSLDGNAGVVNEGQKTIAVTVPFGTALTALVATFTDTGSSVDVGTTAQVSGTTANDFTNPVMYLVKAADNSTVTYTVTVTVAADTAKAITMFSINGVAGTIDQNAKTITVSLQTDVNVTALVPTFTAPDAMVKVGTMTQVSGTSPEDFTNPVTYTVVAADNSTATYTVTVTLQ